jgi:MFS family permease
LGSLGSAVGVVSLAAFLSTVGWRWTYLFWTFPILAWGFVILTSPHLRFVVRTDKEGNRGKGELQRWSLILSSGFILFLLAIAVREVGATGSLTFMTKYFVSRKMSDPTASLIFGLGPFMGIVGSLSGGYLGERKGARKALNWTIAGGAISLLFLSSLSEFYLLVLLYVLYSFFSNAMWSPMNALVAQTAPAKDLGRSYSVYFFTDGVTTSLAPIFAAGIIDLSDISLVLPLSALFLVSSLVILHFIPSS